LGSLYCDCGHVWLLIRLNTSYWWDCMEELCYSMVGVNRAEHLSPKSCWYIEIQYLRCFVLTPVPKMKSLLLSMGFYCLNVAIIYLTQM